MLALVHQAGALSDAARNRSRWNSRSIKVREVDAASECTSCCFTHRVDDQQGEDQCEQPRPPPRVLEP